MKTIDFVMETLAHFVKCDDSPPPGAPVHFDDDFEKELICICSASALTPIIHYSLSKSSSRELISHITWERLKELCEATEKRNLEYLSLCGRLSSLFKNEEIDLCFILGSAYAGTIYPSPKLRSLRRIDVLLNEGDLRRAEELLNGVGFTLPLNVPVLKDPEEVLAYFQYYCPCVLHDKRGMEVKIHFRLMDFGPASMPGKKPEGTVIKESADLLPVLSMNDQLIISVLDLNISGFTDLFALVDVGLMLMHKTDMLNWPYILRQLKDEGLEQSFFLSIESAVRALRIPSPKLPMRKTLRLRRELFRKTWHPFESGAPSGALERHLMRFHLLGRSRWRDKIVILKRLLSPRPQWISAFFGRPYCLWLRTRFLILAMAGKLRSKSQHVHLSTKEELDRSRWRAP